MVVSRDHPSTTRKTECLSALALIFTWIGEERLSLGTLTRRLRERGIPRPSAQGRWDRTSVWGILKNPADCGRAAFGKTRARAGAPNGASTPSHGAIGPTVGARVPDPTDEGGLVFCDEDSAMEAPPDERSGNR
ncbi:hypothetical protein CCR95_14245 [Thiocystis minor]|uniref:recombinase family protein n=1 Tax=Thiocystis minor TaxID=61597 RepID=UPI001911BEAB|nr:hypothetical protein [Thiocystis minor]